jgi:uncharacterized RDD family membrane protein YckC
MNNNIDPFEEFEFKPITEGLGFHREQKNLAQKPAIMAKELLTEEAKSLLSTPLPSRKNNAPATAVSSLMFEAETTNSLNRSTDVVDEILRNIQSTKTANKNIQAATQEAFKASGKQVKLEFKKSSVLMAAVFLDMMLVFASTLLCLVLLLAVTKVDLLSNLKNPDEQGFIYISTFSLLLTVGFIYYTCYRSFLGATPGEWAYDQKIEANSTKQAGFYTFKIVLRSLIIIATGVVFLPFFSWVLRKDLTGNLIGLNLVRKAS